MVSQERVILYVEDNVDYADLVLRGFQRHGVQQPVVHLEDGAAAVEYLQRTAAQQERRPHLIVLDLHLPKVSGLDVLRTVKQTPALSDIPVVILTTSAKESDMSGAYALLANSYLVKPDDFPRFDAMLQDLQSYWLLWNRQPGEIQEN